MITANMSMVGELTEVYATEEYKTSIAFYLMPQLMFAAPENANENYSETTTRWTVNNELMSKMAY